MNTQTKDYSKIPCIIKKDEVIAEVNDEFLTYTGFAPEMVLGKSFENVWSELLKISIEPSFAEDLSEAFLFTSKFEARKVFIQKEPDSCTNRTSYYIWDYSDSRLYSEFPYIDYLFSDDSVGVAMYSVPELILLKANQCYLSFLDEPYRRKEFSLGRNIYTIISGYKGSNFEKLTKEMISTGKVLNLKEEAFHGYSRGITYWDTTIVPIYEKECIKYIVQVCHEVTEAVANRLLLLEQSKQIATQKEELAAILENMTDSICIFDKNNNYILFNKAARELFFPSYSYMEKVGDGHYQAENYDFDGNRIPLDKIPANRVKNGEKFSCLHMKVKYPDKTLFLEISGTPVYDAEGNFSMGVLSSRDISELVMKEKLILEQKEKLIEAEVEIRKKLEAAMKMKEDFIYNITHELRTPSAIVCSALQAIDLMYRKEVTPHVGKHLSTIKQNTNRQLRLINNLLDITKMSSGNIRLNKTAIDIVYLTKAIVDSVYVYAGQKGIKIHFTSDISSKEIYLDEEKYERILLNLLSNAVKFTPEDKNIYVCLSVKKKKHSSFVCIDVTDEGIGIPKNKKHLVFERFAQLDNSLTSQAEGTGLGLPLTKLLVEVMDGEISFKSEAGAGTTFTILLPVEKPKAVQSPATCYKPENRFMNDDSRILRAASIEFSDIYFN